MPRDTEAKGPEGLETSISGRSCTREDITYRQVSLQCITPEDKTLPNPQKEERYIKKRWTFVRVRL